MGVQKTTTEQGTGAEVQKGSTVTIEYIGWVKQADGSKHKQPFDKTAGRGPFVCKVGLPDKQAQVIKGWNEGIVGMKVGEKATLEITPDYGYGEGGFGHVIPGNSTLIFDVHLTDVN